MADDFGIEFQLSVDLDNMKEKLEDLVDACQNLKTPLLRAGGVVRSRVNGIFRAQGPGWAPLAGSAEDNKNRREKGLQERIGSTFALKPNMDWVKLHQNLGRGRTGARSIVQRIVREAAGADRWKQRKEIIREQIDAIEIAWKSKLPARGKRKAKAEEKIQKAVNALRSYVDEPSTVSDEPRYQEEPLASGKVQKAKESIKRYQARAAMIERGIAKGPSTKTKEKRYAAHVMREQNYLNKINVYAQVAARSHPPEGGFKNVDQIIRYARREVARAKAHGEVQRRYKRMMRPGGYSGMLKTPMVLSDRERRTFLRQHARRYKATASSTRILGNLDQTIGMKLIGHNAVRIYSGAFISGIHNGGGVAGHGAVIPARPFIFLLNSDAQALAQFIVEEIEQEMRRPS